MPSQHHRCTGIACAGCIHYKFKIVDLNFKSTIEDCWLNSNHFEHTTYYKPTTSAFQAELNQAIKMLNTPFLERNMVKLRKNVCWLKEGYFQESGCSQG